MRKGILAVVFLTAIFIANGQQKGIEIVAVPATNGIDSNCLLLNQCVYLTVRITNIDTLDFSDIPLSLEIHDNNGNLLIILYDTLWGVLQAGSSQQFTFTQCYVVPNLPAYFVIATATAGGNVYSDTLTECVDADDVALTKFINPTCDNFGSPGDIISLTVQLENHSPNKTYEEVRIYAYIMDGFETTVALVEIIPNIAQGVMNYTFTTRYMVPNAPSYSIKVFIESIDNYPLNDTLVCVSYPFPNKVSDYSRTDLSLGQNAPNPATETTRIDYKIPTHGEVVFYVYNMVGQIVYTETVEAVAGKNSLDLNTSGLVSGIYYYSMTFNGEKLVKKIVKH